MPTAADEAMTAALPARPSFIRGVNLGSTFLPENWMTPSFYDGTGVTTLCELVDSDPYEAALRMMRHLDTFITASDFAWISAHGFNTVRVPLGYWNAIGSMGSRPAYVPINPAESFKVLDRYFAWARANGLFVMLDLHGAPGSQNGADHSGCDTMGIRWGADDSVDRSLEAIDALVQRYGAHRAFLGIELLNEPAWKVEWDHGQLLDFYTRAEALVHAASPSALVVFNLLYWGAFPEGFGDWWAGQLVGPNVLLDLHLYDCYGDAQGRTLEGHIAQAHRWREAITSF